MTQSKALVAERYRLIESLGAGGMGRVWLARDEMLRRDVAIKEVIPPEGLTEAEREELRLRTLREARAAARLNDANVVRIYDVVQTEQRPWIVMEYVPSRSLHQVITEDGPLPPERVAQIGLAVLGALKAAHGAGVLHRDVKPGNVLLADTGRVVLTDFGLAVFEGGDGAVTRPGLILGSPQYISPERARDGLSGPESDLWSLGATLYAAVEGRSPYARSTTFATLTALATEEPDPATRAGVLKPAINGLLRKDPKARAGMAETERLLLRAAAGEGRPWTSWTLPRPRKSRENNSGSLKSASGGSGNSPPVGAGAVIAASVEVAADAAPADRRIDYPGKARGSFAVPLPLPVEVPVTPRSRRWAWVAGAAAVVVMAGLVLFAQNRGGTPEARSTHQPAAPVLVAPSPSLSPQVVGTVGTAPMQLPSGYGYQTDPVWGWTVAVPTDWIRTPDPASKSLVYFVDKFDSRRRMGIDTSFAPPAGSAVVAWQQQESMHKGDYPGYQRVSIAAAQFVGACAEWQWTYDSTQGRVHVSDLGCRIRPDLGQAIYWQTPAETFGTPQNQAVYGIILGSFRWAGYSPAPIHS